MGTLLEKEGKYKFYPDNSSLQHVDVEEDKAYELIEAHELEIKKRLVVLEKIISRKVWEGETGLTLPDNIRYSSGIVEISEEKLVLGTSYESDDGRREIHRESREILWRFFMKSLVLVSPGDEVIIEKRTVEGESFNPSTMREESLPAKIVHYAGSWERIY